jgi:hypothetical protein
MAYSAEEAQEIKDRVCLEIAEGKSLRSICEADDMPAAETIRVWLIEDGEFSAQYTRAREEQADFYADEIIDIADTAKDANLARLQIDARKWKASKLQPKKYGDKLALDADLNLKADDTIAGLLTRIAAEGKRLGTQTDDEPK